MHRRWLSSLGSEFWPQGQLPPSTVLRFRRLREESILIVRTRSKTGLTRTSWPLTPLTDLRKPRQAESSRLLLEQLSITVDPKLSTQTHRRRRLSQAAKHLLPAIDHASVLAQSLLAAESMQKCQAQSAWLPHPRTSSSLGNRRRAFDTAAHGPDPEAWGESQRSRRGMKAGAWTRVKSSLLLVINLESRAMSLV